MHRSSSLYALAVGLGLAGCHAEPPTSSAGVVLTAAKGGNGATGGDALVVDFITGDFVGDAVVTSACSGDSQASYNVSFGDTDEGTNGGCLSITTSDGTQLVDDLYFTLNERKARVQFWGRDGPGLSGTGYESDPAPISARVTASPAGFTVHVHATNVPVYRLSGHLSMKRVGPAGTVDLGDLVYRQP